MLLGGYATVLLVLVQGLVMVPLYLRSLSAATYGGWVATGDVLGWLAVLDLGVGGISAQRMAAAHGRGDARAVGDYFGAALLLQACSVAALTGLAVWAAPRVPALLHLAPEARPELAACFAVAAIATGLGMLANVVSTLALAVQRMVFVNVATLSAGLGGIGTTLALLLAGRGLWALALGMLARAAILLVAVGGHAAWVLRRDLPVGVRVHGAALRDVSGLFPITLLTKLANAAVGSSDAILIALFYGPSRVIPYVLTRRAADVLAMMLARLGGAVYPGFAHLVGSGDHARAATVLGQVARLYLVAAVPAVAVYMALNRSFVALWVGADRFGGQGLTVLVGLNVLLVGRAAFVTYVAGAAGLIARSGVTLFAEAVARVALGIALLQAWGPDVLPAAGVVSSVLPASLMLGWMYRRLEQPRPRTPGRAWVVAGVLLGLGAAAGTARWGRDWSEFAAWGALFAAAAAAASIALDPAIRVRTWSALDRLRRRRTRATGRQAAS